MTVREKETGSDASNPFNTKLQFSFGFTDLTEVYWLGFSSETWKYLHHLLKDDGLVSDIHNGSNFFTSESNMQIANSNSVQFLQTASSLR